MKINKVTIYCLGLVLATVSVVYGNTEVAPEVPEVAPKVALGVRLEAPS